MTKVSDNIDRACSRNSAASGNEGLPGYLQKSIVFTRAAQPAAAHLQLIFLHVALLLNLKNLLMTKLSDNID